MRYPFRCTACGLEFIVARPISEASRDAFCPTDGGRAERIFTVPEMNLNRPAPPTPAPPSRGFSHSGHSHGPGTGYHTH